MLKIMSLLNKIFNRYISRFCVDFCIIMKTAYLLFALIAISKCFIDNDNILITRESLEKLRRTVGYEIYNYDEHPFKNLKTSEIRNKLGLLGIPAGSPVKLPHGKSKEDLPKNFLSSEKWPRCIHPIRDQMRCGSCWAFAASEVLSDRFCISSIEEINVILSPQDMVACDKFDYGCLGGYLDRSWNYLIDEGIVSEECYPYTAGSGGSCECILIDGQCINPQAEYKKYHASAFYNFKSINEIKTDILYNGPVETGFLVYADFLSYKSGIYKKASDQFMGGHAVKVVGWGFEDSSNTHYWIVANSWGLIWGEEGFFKIEIGNCCDFESQMISGTPKIVKNDY